MSDSWSSGTSVRSATPQITHTCNCAFQAIPCACVCMTVYFVILSYCVHSGGTAGCGSLGLRRECLRAHGYFLHAAVRRCSVARCVAGWDRWDEAELLFTHTQGADPWLMADIFAGELSALHYAVRAGSKECVAAMLDFVKEHEHLRRPRHGCRCVCVGGGGGPVHGNLLECKCMQLVRILM